MDVAHVSSPDAILFRQGVVREQDMQPKGYTPEVMEVRQEGDG